MLCSHSVRDGPCKRYAERGSATNEARSHLSPVFRINLNTQGDMREMPTTSPNTALSLCHPMAAPGAYSVRRTCCSSEVAVSANVAALSRNGSKKDGMSSVLRSSLVLKSYCQPNETTRRFPT